MPAILFPASGQTFKITGSNDFTSNAASWYINDLNILTTTENTASSKTYTFENDIINFGTIPNVKFFTTTTNEIVYDTSTYIIVGSDENTSNFIPYYTNDRDIINVSRNNTLIRTFYINNYTVNLGDYKKVRLFGPSFFEEVEVIRKTNKSFTIATNANWQPNLLGFGVGIGRFLYTPVVPYSNDIAINTNTNQSLTITRPVGFPGAGSTIYIIIPYGVQNLAPMAGIDSNLTNAAIKQITKPIVEALTTSTSVPYTKGIKVELRNEQTKNTFALAKSLVKATEPSSPLNRTITYSTASSVFYTNPIRVAGRSGITSDFVNYYIFENNRLVLTRSTSNQVTLYLDNFQNYGIVSNVELIGPSFSLNVVPISYTPNSVTIVDIFKSGGTEPNYFYSELSVRLGISFIQQNAQIGNLNLIPQIERYEIGPMVGPSTGDLLKSSKVSISTKLKDTNAQITQGNQRSVSILKDTRTIQPQNIVTSASTFTLFSEVIDIGGTTKTTSSFVSYYINENNILTTFTDNTTTTTLIFTRPVIWNPTPSVVRVIAYQIVIDTELPVLDITLPVLAITTQSVTINYPLQNYKLKIQLGSQRSRSGGIFSNYYVNELAVANLGAQKFVAKTNQIFEIDKPGNLRRQSEKLTASTANLTPNKFKQEIIIKGQGINFAQRTTIVTTSTATLLDPFPIYVYGSNLTTSTAVKYYLNDEDILITTNSTSNLVTLYFDNLPIYQRTYSPQIRLIAPNAAYDLIHNIVTATSESITIQKIGNFPNISGMYFYWLRQGQIETYRYSDTGQIPQLNKQRFKDFQDPTTTKIYSSFTSTEQGWVNYDRRVTNISYVGTTTELTLNAPIEIPAYGEYAKIQYVDNNYYRTVPNTRRAVRFDGTSSTITFDIVQVFRSVETNRTPIMAEAWINVDVVEASVIMAESFFSFRSSILTLAIGGGPDIAGTKVWFGFKELFGGWSYAISTTSLQPNTWYHVAGQFDGTEITLYINGKKDGASVIPPNGWNAYLTANSFGFRIGQKYNFFADAIYRAFFRGLIYQARVVQGQLVYTKNFLPPLNTSLTENSGATKFLACAFPIDQPLAQNYIGFPTPISYSVGGGLTFEIASIPPRYTFDAYPEEIYEINSATSTKIYLKGRIAYRPITDLASIQDDFSDRPINIFDIYFLGTSKTYPVIRSVSSVTATSSVVGNLKQSLPKISFGIEIPNVGKTLSIPKLRETLGFSSKSVVSVNSRTEMTFSPIAIPVYGTSQTTSTFVNYYINELDTFNTISTQSGIVTLYLGNNPEYYRPIGTRVRVININNGYDVQHDIVTSTFDSITISGAKDLPPATGLFVYYGSTLTSYPSVIFSDSNAVGRINKNTIAQLWTEVNKETSGKIKESVIIRAEPNRFKHELMDKSVNVLRGSIEIPRVLKFSTNPKISDPGIFQNPTYTITTSTGKIFTGNIGLSRVESTSTFIPYYIFENNTFVSIYSTGTFKVFNLNETINLAVGYDTVRIQGYVLETIGENILFDLTLPVAAITSSTITVDYPGSFPYLLYRASLGKSFITFRQIFSGTNNVSLLNFYRTQINENDQIVLSTELINKSVTQLKDLQPGNNFQIGNYGQTKLKVAGDRTYDFSTSTISYSTSTIFLNPVQVSGINRSTSDFQQYYLTDSLTLGITYNTSSLVTLYFAQDIPYNGLANVVKISKYGTSFYLGNSFQINNIEFELTYPIISYTTSSVTINVTTGTDLRLGSIAAFIGYDYQQPNSISYVNSSTLAVPLVNYYKTIIGQKTYAISTFTERLSASIKVKGIEVPIRIENFKPKSSATLKGLADNIKLSRAITIPIVKDGYFPNLNTRIRNVTTVTTIVYETQAYKIIGTNLTTSSFVSNYLFDTDIVTSFSTSTATITLDVGSLPVIDPGLGLYARITNNADFNTVTQILSRGSGSITINTPANLPTISNLFLYYGALRNVETVTIRDTNFNELNLFNDLESGIAFRKDIITYPTFTPISVQVTGTNTLFSFNYIFTPGQQSFTIPGTYSWVAPAGVTSVSVVAIGGGGGSSGTAGAGGGGLGWKNNIPVIPGQSYSVVVGAGGLNTPGGIGGTSFFINTATVAGFGGSGSNLGTGGSFVGDGGGTGGSGGNAGTNAQAGGGGGAGGYTGSGGRGGGWSGLSDVTAGTGGGGGGGGAGDSTGVGGGGGGTGINGIGADGAAGFTPTGSPNGALGQFFGTAGGGGGSGGTSGGQGISPVAGVGGIYGGGAGAGSSRGGQGAVRIVWGINRSYPTTNLTDGVSYTSPTLGTYVKILDLLGNSVLTPTTEIFTNGFGIATSALSNLTGSATTWSFNLWDPSVYPQTQVKTKVAPVKPRENLYYSQITPAKYGIPLTVYPRDIVSPLNLIPDKTRIVTSSTGIVWNYSRSFNIYGTDLTRQTDLSWYTTDANFLITTASTSNTLTLYFGPTIGSDAANYFNNSHIRLYNPIGYDQAFAILTSTNESITITKPVGLPSITRLQALFGSTGTVETLVWNDQGLVPTFTTNLSTSTALLLNRLVLAGGDLITLPYSFKIANKIRESENILSRPLPRIDQEFTATITSYIPANLRPTNPRERLAVGLVAPGLRFHRTIQQGISFVDFNNNFKASAIQSSVKVKPASNVDNVFSPVSVNTATRLTDGINSSPKSILYYTNIAPGIRGGISYSIAGREIFESYRRAGVQDVIPTVPEILGDFQNLILKTVYVDPFGSLTKPVIRLKGDFKKLDVYKLSKATVIKGDSLPNYAPAKLIDLQKDQFQLFSLDPILSLLQESEFIDLRAVVFSEQRGQVTVLNKLNPGLDIRIRPFGVLKQANKVVSIQNLLHNTGKVKISPEGIHEPLDIQLTVNVRGLITKFAPSRSGNLHDPSTRRAVPIQFWN